MNSEEFEQLINALYREQNQQTRQQAEEMYFEYRKQEPSDNFVANMINVIKVQNDLSDFACVLLREDMDKNGSSSVMYRLEDLAEGAHYIDELLIIVASTKSEKILQIVAQYASDLMEKNVPVNNVFGFIQQAYSSPDAKILSVELVSEMISMHYNEIKKWPFSATDFLVAAISDPDNAIARYAIVGMTKILTDGSLESGITPDFMKEQTQMMMERIAQTLTQNDEKNAVKMLTSLQDVVGFIGEQIIEMIPNILTLLTQIMNSPLTEQIKCQAIRIFLEITENIQNVRKYLAEMISHFLRDYILPYTSTITEEEIRAWVAGEDDIEYRSDSLQALCEDTFESASYTLGKQIILPLLLNSLIEANKQQENWQLVLSCLNAICFAAEGLKDVIKQKEVDEFIKNILVSSQNPNPRVRYAVMECIGQLSTDWQPQTQKNDAAIMNVIMQLVQDECHRVAFHAVAAAINFNSGLDYDKTYKYLDQFREILTFAWASGKMEGQTNALTLLSSLNEVLDKEDMQTILEQIMPEILQEFEAIMSAITSVETFSKNEEEFISALIESISMSAESVPELFKDIADSIMSSLVTIVDRCYTLEEGDMFSDAFDAIGRVSSCLNEQQMNIYIQKLYPFIVKSIEKKIINVGHDVSNEGEVNFSEHAMKLEQAVFLSLVSFLDKFPTAFAPVFDELSQIILDFNSLSMPELEVARLECLAQLVKVAEKCNRNVSQIHEALFPQFMKEIVPSDTTSVCEFDISQVTDCYDAISTYIESYLGYVKDTNDKSAYEETIEEFCRALTYLQTKAMELFTEQFKDLEETNDLDEDELDAEEEDLLESFEECVESLGYCYTCYITSIPDPELIQMRVLPVIQQFVECGVTIPQMFYTKEGYGLCADLLSTDMFELGDAVFEQIAAMGLEYLEEAGDKYDLLQSIYFFFGEFQNKHPESQTLKSQQIIQYSMQLLDTCEEDGSDDALLCMDNICSYLMYAGDQMSADEQFWTKWASYAVKMDSDGDEIENVLIYIVQKFIGNQFMDRVQLFWPVVVNLFFGKFYSDIKNDENLDSKKLVEQMKQLLSNENFMELTEELIKSNQDAEQVAKNYENFTE